MEAAGTLAKVNNFVDMGLRNAEVVNAIGMAGNITKRWDETNQEVLRLQTTLGNRSNTIMSLTKLVRTLLQMLSMGAGVYLIITNEASPGIMLAATFLMGKTMQPVEMAIGSWQMLVQARSAYTRLELLLDAANQERHEYFELPPPEGHLSVEQVVFGRSASKLILKGISFQLQAGDSLAIIGPSAAGKSTLTRVILGIWPTLSGVVRLDGASIADWDRNQLGHYIGYLPQDVELFSGTVAENICRLGNVEVCSQDIVAAAHLACAHEMILRLPNGYDTEIGEQGEVLSGGQRQRIALARALFGKPKVVLLDEPNSNLDSEGEQALVLSVNKLREMGTTVIVVTHRVSVLAYVNKILLLNDGKVEMFGPRQDVLDRLNQRAVTSPAAT
jgi:PrtD family type I secretion system ABC transporter